MNVMVDGKCIYDAVTMKMKYKWKSNWTVSCMETKYINAARKAAGNSTWLQWDGFKRNIGKSQGNESVLVDQLIDKISTLESAQKSSKHIV